MDDARSEAALRGAILVGVGEQRASRDAVALGAKLASELALELIVAEAGAPDRERVFAAVDSQLAGHPYRRFDLEGNPERALPELAERVGALLIVIGATHRGSLGRLFPGALVDKLAAGGRIPVAVAPHEFARQEHRGVGILGVAFDGSAEARAALDVGRALAPVLDAQLEVITVAPTFPSPDDPMVATREEMYRERQAAAVGSLPPDEPAAAVFDRGDPAAVLARHAVDLDLLIVGAHAHRKLVRTLIGSVGSDLSRTAPCPILLVPARGAERAQQRRASP